MDHFILHVTTTDGSIKDLYLLTDRRANKAVWVVFFLVVQTYWKREAPQSQTPDNLEKGPYVLTIQSWCLWICHMTLTGCNLSPFCINAFPKGQLKHITSMVKCHSMEQNIQTLPAAVTAWISKLSAQEESQTVEQ